MSTANNGGSLEIGTDRFSKLMKSVFACGKTHVVGKNHNKY